MSSKFSNLSTGRPSQSEISKAKMLKDLSDKTPSEPLRRVNFEVTESKHTKLKINAARRGQTIREFLTAYIDTLPGE